MNKPPKIAPRARRAPAAQDRDEGDVAVRLEELRAVLDNIAVDLRERAIVAATMSDRTAPFKDRIQAIDRWREIEARIKPPTAIDELGLVDDMDDSALDQGLDAFVVREVVAA